MSLSDQRKMAPELAARVATRFLQAQVSDKLAAFSMDMFARLSMLEGAAGKTPGTWLRKGERGFGDALEFFGPHLAASWTTTRNEGVYDKALAVATRVLSAASGLEAVDLIQDMTINSSRSGGPDRTKLFYTVGKKLKSHKHDLGRGQMTPRDNKVLGTIDRWVHKAAISELQSWRARNVQHFGPGTAEGFDPTRTRGTRELDSETRDHLILLALQSPGGPGDEVRRTIDRLVDQSFPRHARPIVKVFLQKISNPKYRSAEQMRQIVKRFTPEKWFSQALTVILREIREELGVTPQQVTNALGGKAKKVFKFMTDVVGRDNRVKRIINDLAEEIDLLEPGVSRVADDKESELTEKQTPLEPNSVMFQWLQQQFADDDDDGEKEAEHHLPHQDQHDVLHDIFEKDEYMDWDSVVGPHGVHNRGPVVLRVARRFLLGAETPPANPDFIQWVGKKKWKHPKSGEEILFVELEPEVQMKVYKKWEAGEKGSDEKPEKPEKKPEPEEKKPAPEKAKVLGPEEIEKFLSTPPEERIEDEVKDSRGNTFSGEAKVQGDPNIRNSKIKDKGQVNGEARVEDSTVSGNAIVEDHAAVSRSEISGHARLRGTTKVVNAKIKGGSWDGQQIPDGRGGIFHDAYPQDVITALLRVATADPGPGDGPVQAMARYFADGGRTKGGLGVEEKLDRKALQKLVQEHVYDKYDKKNAWIGRGASALDEFDDEGFEKILAAAKAEAPKLKAKREKKGSEEKDRHMLYALIKAAFVHPELRADLMPLVKFGHEARVASRTVDLRGLAIRTAFATPNQALRAALLTAVQESGHTKTAERRGRRYRQPFLRWISNRKFRHPDTSNEVVFDSLPSQEQSRIYQEWQGDYRDWARRHAPEGLGEGTRITGSNFDDVEVGDVLWYNASPGKLLKVTGINREGWRERNPTLELVQIDLADSDFEGATRNINKSTLRNDFLEVHKVPGHGPGVQREQQQRQREDEESAREERRREVRSQLPREPQGGWPDFDDVGLGDRKREQLQQAFKAVAETRNLADLTLPRIREKIRNALGDEPSKRATKAFMHHLRDWAGDLAGKAREAGPDFRRDHLRLQAIRARMNNGIAQLDGEERDDRRSQQRARSAMKPNWEILPDVMLQRWDEDEREKMAPVFAEAMKGARTGIDDGDADRLIRKLEKLGVDLGGAGRPVALSALAQFLGHAAEHAENDEQKNKLLRGRGDAAHQAARYGRQLQQRRDEARRRHRGRDNLRGGGAKAMEDEAKLGSWFISQVLPQGATGDVKRKAKEQLKRATYNDLDGMLQAAGHILDNWGSEFAQNHALVKHLGYDRDGLKKLQKLLKRKMQNVHGRTYHADVLRMANKYGLESEDADALYDWRVDKPFHGRPLSDQEKFNRFMAKAKPETRERMQNMSLQDFMVMYKAILKEILDEEEEVQAA